MDPTALAGNPGPEPPASSRPPWERWGLWLILAVFAGVGFNHIRTNALYGQDFLLHSSSTEDIMAHPNHWFPQDFTNRPLVYWIGALGYRVTGGLAPWEAAALAFIVMNTAALAFVHDSTRRFIRSPALRLGAIAFLAFLPATQIAGIVYAADAVCQLPFALLGWGLIRSVEATTGRSRAGFALLAGLGLGLGGFARFTFVMLLPAAAGAILLLARARRVTWPQAFAIGGLALTGPALIIGGIHRFARRAFVERPAHHTFNWHGTGEMTWPSLLLVKPADVRILEAPSYWQTDLIDGAQRLGILVNNRYSYPALFHLSIFTDVLDYANEGQIDDGAPRPEPQKTYARWSVRLGLLFSVPAVLAVLLFTVRCLAGAWRPDLVPDSGAVVWGVLALGWYVPIAGALPFVYNSYDWGYWLSRLVIPALWGFGLLLFAAADRLFASRPWRRGLLTAVVLLQALLHIRSLWY